MMPRGRDDSVGIDEEMLDRITRVVDAIEKGMADGSVSLRLTFSIPMNMNVLVARMDGDHKGRAIVFWVFEESLSISLWDTDSFGVPVFPSFPIGTLTMHDHEEMMARAAVILSRGIAMTSERGRGDFNDMMESIEGGVS